MIEHRPPSMMRSQSNPSPMAKSGEILFLAVASVIVRARTPGHSSARQRWFTGRRIFLNLVGQREASLCSLKKDLLAIEICEFVRRSATSSGI